MKNLVKNPVKNSITEEVNQIVCERTIRRSKIQAILFLGVGVTLFVFSLLLGDDISGDFIFLVRLIATTFFVFSIATIVSVRSIVGRHVSLFKKSY